MVALERGKADNGAIFQAEIAYPLNSIYKEDSHG